ncbi:MAG: DUF4390 domain-containing protein [Nitrospirae bacterium]|nr:DUF4390 domain-containing protein [Nitrospirota bacterium]
MTRIAFRLALLLLLLSPVKAFPAEISGPEVRIQGNEIVVNAALTLDDRNLSDVKNGISKEITFYADLFRVWNMWPDEFITGKKIVKTLWCDPIKKEYVATSFDGAVMIEKRFKTFNSMLNWTLTVRDLKLINVRELQPSSYFVKLTVESRVRKLPPVIGYLLFFVPEKDFKVFRDSPSLTIGSER